MPCIYRCIFSPAPSIGQRNTCIKSFCRRFKLQRLAGPFVELPRHLVQFSLRVCRQVCPFGEVLSEQAIGVLVGTALPRTLRITEVNVDVCRQAKPSMICEFLAPVPGQGFVQLGRQLLGLPDERGDDRLCIFTGPLTSITYRVWRSTKAAMWLFFDPDSRSPSQ